MKQIAKMSWYPLLFSFFLPLVTHDFHVSRIQMDYIPDEHHFEVSLHVFTDDLTLALTQNIDSTLYLHTASELPGVDSVIVSYLQQHLQLSKGKARANKIRWLGKESSDDYMATWIYFYWPVPESMNGEIKLQNTILFEVFDDQQNILQVTGNSAPFVTLLTKGNSQTSVNLP